jgi:release factor glutamine methyltransferase
VQVTADAPRHQHRDRPEGAAAASVDVDRHIDLDAVVDRLMAAGCVAAEEEAADYLAAAPDAATLEAWLLRREQGEPPAWITGTTVFCGRPLRVMPGVYVPRAQTEELAERAAARLPPAGRAVDLCTGSGAVAAHLRAEVPAAASVVGVDLDPRAAACARRNGVPAVAADIGALPLGVGVGLDLVTAVAPYVPTGDLGLLPADVQRYEPRLALDGGSDGLDLVRRVVGAAGRLLRPGGWLLAEVGGVQDESLGSALSAAGFVDVTAWRDEDGDLRGIAARRAPVDRHVTAM